MSVAIPGGFFIHLFFFIGGAKLDKRRNIGARPPGIAALILGLDACN